MIDLDSKSFEEVIGNFTEGGAGFRSHSKPFLLYLYTPTCTNCKMVGPLLEKIENQYGSYKFVKADATDLYDFCEAVSLSTVPGIFLISGDGNPMQLTGIPTESNLKKVLEDFLK